MTPLDTNAAGPIGIYDSGVGGLSVIAAIRELLPHEDLLYVADAGHLPYGEKSTFYVVERAWRIAEYFAGRGAKAIAIPCNTATAAAAAVLRDHYPQIPVVGIEPAVKPAARATRSGVIGVLATTGTLLSAKFQQLVRREAPGVEVLLKPCPGWVELVEQGAGEEETRRLVHEPVDELLAQRADVLVLGCTHFPFLLDTVRARVGPDVAVLETARPFASELARRIMARGQVRQSGQGSLQIMTSGDPVVVQRRVERLLSGAGTVLRLPERYC